MHLKFAHEWSSVRGTKEKQVSGGNILITLGMRTSKDADSELGRLQKSQINVSSAFDWPLREQEAAECEGHTVYYQNIPDICPAALCDLKWEDDLSQFRFSDSVCF